MNSSDNKLISGCSPASIDNRYLINYIMTKNEDRYHLTGEVAQKPIDITSLLLFALILVLFILELISSKKKYFMNYHMRYPIFIGRMCSSKHTSRTSWNKVR